MRRRRSQWDEHVPDHIRFLVPQGVDVHMTCVGTKNSYRLRPGRIVEVALADVSMLLLAGCMQVGPAELEEQ
jgi:hypothetical protein